MASLPLVYVHGAGPQAPVADLKRETDRLIFGKEMSSTRVGYYANVRWPAASGGIPAAAPPGASRARRSRAIRGAMGPEITADAAAEAIVAATLTAPAPRGAGAAAAPPPVPATDLAKARALVEELYQEADRIASRSPRPRRRGTALNISFPDPIFRFVVGKFASDVIDYLYGPFKAAMRAPVRKALLRSPRPKDRRRAQPGDDHHLRRAHDDARACRLPARPPRHPRLPARHRQRPEAIRDGAGRPNPVPDPASRPGPTSRTRSIRSPSSTTLRDEFDPPKDFARRRRRQQPGPQQPRPVGLPSVALSLERSRRPREERDHHAIRAELA